ncbi:hypothetical protein [Georgenia yuyongxinii]
MSESHSQSQHRTGADRSGGAGSAAGRSPRDAGAGRAADDAATRDTQDAAAEQAQGPSGHPYPDDNPDQDGEERFDAG